MDLERHTQRTDEIIGEIAKKCKHVLGKDDPILMVAAFNDRLIEDYRAAVTNSLDQATASLKTEREEWLKANRELASQILTSTLHEAAKKISEHTDKEINRIQTREKITQRKSSTNWSWWTWFGVVALVAFSAAASTITLEIIRNRLRATPTPTHHELGHTSNAGPYRGAMPPL